jgi:tRNA modification GTPase
MPPAYGEFSRRIHVLIEDLIKLRTFVEAALDFPEDDIDSISNSSIAADLNILLAKLDSLLTGAQQGNLIREGIRVVIAGPPNVGKSSLLNALSGTETAIVTAIPGTTRDILHREIQIDGMPLQIIDTAGLRYSDDLVEREGVRRAQEQIGKADIVLWLSDDSPSTDPSEFDLTMLPSNIPAIMVRNKIDLSGHQPGLNQTSHGTEIAISARNGAGIDSLRHHLKQVTGYQEMTEGVFLARRRHLDALLCTKEALTQAQYTLKSGNNPEITAEEIRLAQNFLGEITGEFTPDDLLGRIFADFCVGK